MTSATILTKLGYLLDDPNGERYSDTIKSAILNSVQLEIAGKVPSGLLSLLQKNTAFTGVSAGNSLPSDYFRYVNSYLYAVDPIKWISKIEADDLGMYQDNQYSQGSDLDPLCYIWNSKYCLLVTTSSYNTDNSKVALLYLSVPTFGTDGKCQLHETLQEPLIALANCQLRMTYKYGDPSTILEDEKRAWAKINDTVNKFKNGEIL